MDEKQAKRSRRTAAEIKNLLETFSQSGMAARDFCILHSLSEAGFYKWRSRYGNTPAARENNFILLEGTSGYKNGALLFAEVKGIKIYQTVTASYLKELIG